MLLDKNNPARNNTQHSSVSLHKFENTGAIPHNDAVLPDIGITEQLLSIQRADWPKLHDMFKARDSNTWQRQFPVEFPVQCFCLEFVIHQRFSRRCCSYRRPMRDLNKTCLIGLLISSILRWKIAFALKCSCTFSRTKSNELSGQQNIYLLHDYTLYGIDHCSSSPVTHEIRHKSFVNHSTSTKPLTKIYIVSFVHGLSYIYFDEPPVRSSTANIVGAVIWLLPDQSSANKSKETMFHSW